MTQSSDIGTSTATGRAPQCAPPRSDSPGPARTAGPRPTPSGPLHLVPPGGPHRPAERRPVRSIRPIPRLTADDVLDDLMALVEAGVIVVHREPGGPPRYAIAPEYDDQLVEPVEPVA